MPFFYRFKIDFYLIICYKINIVRKDILLKPKFKGATVKIKNTGKNIIKKFLCAATAAVLACGMLIAPACGGKKVKSFQPPESTLPTEDKFALNKYSYEELSEVQTTLRADVRNVLERNLPRSKPEILGDNYSVIYNTETQELTTDFENLVESTETLKTATITFDKYPSPNLVGYGMKSADSTVVGTGLGCDGVDDFSNGTAAGTAVPAGKTGDLNYSLFYKYMLLSQGMHLSTEAEYRSANGTLTQEWLKKHPAADEQYGAVLGENNAVKKEITLDPIYRSYHATGLYLPAGEAITVKVEGLKPGERISVVLGVQNTLAWRGDANNAAFNAIAGNIKNVKVTSSKDAYFTKADVLVANGKLDGNVALQPQWARQHWLLPWLSAEFTFTENKEYTIGTPFGGLIEIGMGNCYSRVKTTFTGAVETPHYVLGQTMTDYFDEYLRNAPGVIAVLDTENGQLIGPTGEMGTARYMRQVKTDEIDKLAMLWHSFLSVNESFTGGVYNRFNKVMFDWHVPAGAAVSLGNYSFAQPTAWFGDAMNYRGLLARGTWGTLHEIGHNHAAAYGTPWGFATGREGEVRNNALTLLSYIMFCDVGTTIRNGGDAEHGVYANPYNVLTQTLSFKGRNGDFDDGSYDYFACLGMYANIMHSFGAEKFYELLYTYKNYPSFVAEGTKGNKRSDFAYRCSRIYGMNFIKYFNVFYCANITDAMFTAEQLAEMNALPDYQPVSNFYAGGIDGVKTSGDYNVTFGEDIRFELYKKTISTLDTTEAKGFKILSVDKPDHGKIKQTGDGVWTYSFDKKYTGAQDKFSFTVQLNDGVVHKFTVYLRISYNGSRLSYWKNVQGRNWDAVLNEVASKNPDAVAGNGSADIGSYTTEKGQYDVKVSEFYWRAPQSGEVSFAVKCDDWARAYFGNDFNSLEELGAVSTYTAGYKDLGVTRTVEKGKTYAVKLLNVNTGGGGSAAIAVKYGDDAFAPFVTTDIYHPSFPKDKQAEVYVFEPEYIVSKKDSIKLSITGTDKSEWTVAKAPENIVGGRYDVLIQYDIDPESPTYGQETGRIETDKWSYLIDGLTNTNMHTTYGGGDKKITPDNPQEFIVDTSKVQDFNYFSVTTRNNVNSYINDFELQISDSLDGGWTKVAEGGRDLYKGTTINLKFGEVKGRYWKLIVKGTSGGNFSVLAELDAGIKSTTQQIVPSTSAKLFTTKGWKNSGHIAEEANGYMIARKKNQKLVVKFKGESFALYGATGEGYGSVKIYIDGKNQGTYSMNSAVEEARKLIFNKENLSNKEHTVEIITTSSAKVMLNVIGIPYTANLINAANIYKERALIISLVVFVLLFAALTAFILVLVFVPKFRAMVFGNRLMKKIDDRAEKSQSKAAEKKAAKKAEKKNGEKPVKKSADNETETKTAVKPAKASAPAESEKTAKPAKTAKTASEKPADTVKKTKSAPDTGKTAAKKTKK